MWIIICLGLAWQFLMSQTLVISELCNSYRPSAGHCGKGEHWRSVCVSLQTCANYHQGPDMDHHSVCIVITNTLSDLPRTDFGGLDFLGLGYYIYTLPDTVHVIFPMNTVHGCSVLDIVILVCAELIQQIFFFYKICYFSTRTLLFLSLKALLLARQSHENGAKFRKEDISFGK